MPNAFQQLAIITWATLFRELGAPLERSPSWGILHVNGFIHRYRLVIGPSVVVNHTCALADI